MLATPAAPGRRPSPPARPRARARPPPPPPPWLDCPHAGDAAFEHTLRGEVGGRPVAWPGGRRRLGRARGHSADPDPGPATPGRRASSRPRPAAPAVGVGPAPARARVPRRPLSPSARAHTGAPRLAQPPARPPPPHRRTGPHTRRGRPHAHVGPRRPPQQPHSRTPLRPYRGAMGEGLTPAARLLTRPAASLMHAQSPSHTHVHTRKVSLNTRSCTHSDLPAFIRTHPHSYCSHVPARSHK